MRVPILSGLKVSGGEFRQMLPRNYAPIALEQGLSKGFLKPCEGIEKFGELLLADSGDRGGIRWNDECYRVLGTAFVKVTEDGSVTNLGVVRAGGVVSMDYSFDRLAIASGGSLYYWDGAALTLVTDPDMGTVLDVLYEGGYFITTDGEFIVVTELNNPEEVDPRKYGSSEADPDLVKAMDKIGGEIYALNRYSIEAFENIGGSGFPLQRIDSARVTRGILGTHSYAKLEDTFIFLGGGRNEPPGLFVMTPGGSAPISTREVDSILRGYTEAELIDTVIETRVEKAQALVYIHLPNQTIVYDVGTTKAAGVPVWYTLDSGGPLSPSRYRARGFVWCYDRWIVGNPVLATGILEGIGGDLAVPSAQIGTFTEGSMTHYGQTIGWEFGTMALYADGNDGIIHEMELVGLPGRVAFGKDPVIWTSYSHDGETWSQEHAIKCGKQGERQKRLMWRKQGKIRHYRMQKFRGTSDAMVAFSALEIAIEPLITRAGRG